MFKSIVYHLYSITCVVDDVWLIGIIISSARAMVLPSLNDIPRDLFRPWIIIIVLNIYYTY